MTIKTPQELAIEALAAEAVGIDDLVTVAGSTIVRIAAAAIEADRAQRIQVGDVVEHVNKNLDARKVIAVGDGWLLLDFQQRQIDEGEMPTLLPSKNYRKVA